MAQAFQWVDEIVRRLKALWFTGCAQVVRGGLSRGSLKHRVAPMGHVSPLAAQFMMR